jgi:peptidoglycan/LPS O-acetylase OafA/YrhL
MDRTNIVGAQHAKAPSVSASAFRPESQQIAAIQALRALAVSWVVLCHAFPHQLPGGYIGVDIFFVISGFLITSHIMRQFEAGSFRFGRFYLRRARRLLPAALVTLSVTGVASLLLLPPAWQASALTGIGAASVYVVNWWLAATSVNYFADGGMVSPVNHFWSLSVEEQFYLVWPALMWLAWRGAIFARRGKIKIGFPGIVASALLVICMLSLGAAIVAMRQSPAAVYFFTDARAWEFALGGLAGIIVRLGLLRVAGPARPLLFLSAWVVLIGAGWLFGPHSGVPGPATLPVILAAALLVVIGDDHRSPFAARIIALPPVQWLGDNSYSIYLWHWPLLVLAPFALNVQELKIGQILLLLIVTLILAGLSRRYLENPFRVAGSDARGKALAGKPWLQLAAFLSLSVLIAGCMGGAAHHAEGKAQVAAQRLYDLSQNPAPCFGARATEAGADCPFSHRLAEADFALQNWATQIIVTPNSTVPASGHACQNAPGEAALTICSFGAPAESARRHIVLLGDSHAGMWESALGQFVAQKGIRVTTLLASSCPDTDDPSVFATYLMPAYRAGCLAWRKAATAYILADPTIDMVVVSGNAYNLKRLTPNGWAEDDGAGFAALWRRFADAGKRVVVIDDVPGLPFKLPECLARPHPAIAPCTYPRASIPSSTPLARAVALMPPGEVKYITFKNVFCDATTCQTVIGGIPAYMDADHISAPFSRSLAGRLEVLISPEEVGKPAG